MIVTCAMLALSLAGLRAQSNFEYNFRQQSVVDQQSAFGTPPYGNGDPLPVLSMDCLAANGYGQWTLSSTAGSGGSGSGATEFPAGWYLLENGLYPPCTGFVSGDPTHPQCIPPGVVQCGTLNGVGMTSPSEVKCTANLDGSVFFVWPDADDRTIFHVQFFGPSDINISIPTGFPNAPAGAPSTRNVVPFIPSAVYAQPHEFTVSTEAGGFNRTIVSEESIGGNWKDDFSVSSDAEYLYITWCTTDNYVVIPGGTFDDDYISEYGKVLVMAIPLGTTTPATGYPAVIGQGMRPTISCDPRYTRGGGLESFEVAYINTVGGNLGDAGSLIGYQKVHNGTWVTNFTLTPEFIDPEDLSLKSNIPLHVCMLTGSVYEGSSSSAIYAIVTGVSGYTTNMLILYKNFGSLTDAAYVDGQLFDFYNDPILNGNYVGVVDAPITGIANPYDNQTGPYDQFHCIYQDIIQTGANMGRKPLIIVQGSDNDLYGTSTYDSRLVLSQVEVPTPTGTLLPDPSSYVAAVNQMGIHVHWRTTPMSGPGTHYYARDMNRTFDEPIDEVTLVTDQCTVSDGSITGTNHGGTVGAIIEAPLMTIWTDPNYGSPSGFGTTGLYSPITLSSLNPYVGTLNFVGSGVNLQVGGGDYQATLSVMPFFYFNFQAEESQGVAVESNSSFDYWGLNATHDPTTGVLTGIATPFTDGSADGYGAGTIYLAANSYHSIPNQLTVHGGSDFYIGAAGTLISNGADIEVLDENSVYPINPSILAAATGHMTLWGSTTIENSSYVVGDAPGATSSNLGMDVIITSYGDFAASSSLFENVTTYGLANIQFGDVTGNTYASVSITSCNFLAAQVHVLYPSCANLIIEDNTFGYLRNYGMLIEQNTHDPSTAIRPPMTITGNYFYNFAPDADMTINGNLPLIYGIWIRNFAAPPNTTACTGSDDNDHIGPILVADNNFTYTWNYSSALNIAAAGQTGVSGAITLENTTAYVINNIVSDNGYETGIIEYASKWEGNYPTTFSLLCGNTISGMKYEDLTGSDVIEEFGIATQKSAGYIKLNTVTDCDVSYTCDLSDRPKLIYNTFTGDRCFGILVWDASIIDLSGIHGGGNDDGGHNFITGPSPLNPYDLSDPIPAGLITFLDYGNIYFANFFGVSGYSNWGMNNISVDRPPAISEYPLIIRVPYDVPLVNIGSINENYWPISGGGGTNLIPITSGTNYYAWNLLHDASEYDSYFITYNKASDAPLWTIDTTLYTNIGCDTAIGYPGEGARKKGAKPQSLLDTVQDTCGHLLGQGIYYGNNYLWQQAYDTLKLFIEECPNYYQSWQAFVDMSSAVQSLGSENPSDSLLWVQFRQWLESVLYLNTTDPEYFCQCVETIGGTFYSPSDTTVPLASKATNTDLAVTQWLIENTSCDSSDNHFGYTIARKEQYQNWYNDSIAGYHWPLDTTLPTMAQLGLDTLLEKHLLAAVRDPTIPSIILSATASPNPVSTGTIITFGLNQEAYVKINLFDILGHGIEGSGGEGFEGLFEPGNHEVPLSLQGLPSGTYFARILTAYGNVATVKLVKE